MSHILGIIFYIKMFTSNKRFSTGFGSETVRFQILLADLLGGEGL